MSTRKVHYVNNRDFYECLVKYKKNKEINQNAKIPNYIGVCVLQICNRLSTKPNFSGYTFKDEMVADAIENCISAINGFNPEKSQNPFAYFTQIAWNAFLRRIHSEKKEVYIKHKNMLNISLTQTLENIGDDYDFGQLNNNDASNKVIESYENKLTKTKKPVNIGIEKFVELSEKNENTNDNTTAGD